VRGPANTARYKQPAEESHFSSPPLTTAAKPLLRSVRQTPETAVDLDELDLIVIDALPSWVWYQDMADFADGITDEHAGRRLARAIDGKGAFRRFKDELNEEYPYLLPAWYAFRDARARRRAVQWLADNSRIDDGGADRFLSGNPDPALP
jgi:Uncharacterised protein family (UPF0158)